jgi:hypothetical protein
MSHANRLNKILKLSGHPVRLKVHHSKNTIHDKLITPAKENRHRFVSD